MKYDVKNLNQNIYHSQAVEYDVKNHNQNICCPGTSLQGNISFGAQ